MADIYKLAAMRSRISKLALLFVTTSLAVFSSVNAAPVGNEDQITLLGPETFHAPLIGTKTTTNTFVSTPQTGYLYLKNGSGEDLSPKECNGLPLLKRLACAALNVANLVRLELERPSSVEIRLNGSVVISSLPKTTNNLLLSIPLLNQNQLSVKIKGSIFSSVTVAVRASSRTNLLPLARINVDRTEIILGQSISLSGQASQALNEGATIVRYEWTLPNGNTFEGMNQVVTFSQAGLKTISLKVTDSLGLVSLPSEIQVNVRALEKPIARMGMSVVSPIVPTTIQLDSSTSSTSNPGASIIGTRWHITAPNGTDFWQHDIEAPVINIDTMDTYTISLEVRDSYNQISDPVVHTFTAINTQPVARIVQVEPSTEPAFVTFDGSQSFDPDGHLLTNWVWTFSDGVELYGPNPQRTFFFPGEYTATLSVLDEHGAWSEPASIQVLVNPNSAPTSVISVSEVPGNKFQRFLDGKGSFDVDGTVTRYYWWILGLEGIIGEGPEITYTFPNTGEYDVYLDVFDDSGLRGTSSVRVSIPATSVPPIARIQATPSLTEAFEIHFSGSDSTDDGQIRSYRWDFGDGNIQYGENTSHTFPSAGFHDIHLMVTDDENLLGFQTITIQVSDHRDRPPLAIISGKLDENHLDEELNPTDFSINRLPAYVVLSAHASDISPSALSGAKYSWQAGELGTFEGDNVRLRVNRTGEFPVTLQVIDGNGRSSQSTTMIKSHAESCFQYDGDNICPFVIGNRPDIIDLTNPTVVFSTNQSGELDQISVNNSTSVTLESSSGTTVDLSAVATANGPNIEILSSEIESRVQGLEEPFILRIGVVASSAEGVVVGGLKDIRIAKRRVSVRVPQNATNLVVVGSASGIEMRIKEPNTNFDLGGLPFDTYAVSVLTESGDLSKSFDFNSTSSDLFDLTIPSIPASIQMSSKSSPTGLNTQQSVGSEYQYRFTNVIPFSSSMPGYPLSNDGFSNKSLSGPMQLLSAEEPPAPFTSWCGQVAPFPIIRRGPNLIPVDRTYGKFLSNNLNGVETDARTFTPVAARSAKEGKIAGYCQFQSPTYMGAQFYEWLHAANRRCCRPEHGSNCLSDQTANYNALTAGRVLESANIQFVAEFKDEGDSAKPIRSWSITTSFQAAAQQAGYSRATMSSTLGLPADGNVPGWAVPFRFEIPIPTDMVTPNVRVNVNSIYPREYPREFGSHFYYCWIETGPTEVLFDLKIGAQHNTTTDFTNVAQNNARNSMRDERLIPVSKDNRSNFNFFGTSSEKWQYSPLFRLSARGTFNQAEFNSANVSLLVPKVTVVVAGDSTEYDVGGQVSISNYSCPTSGNCYGQLNFDGGRIFENVPQFAIANRKLAQTPTIPGVTLRYKVLISNNGKTYDPEDTSNHKLNYDLAPETPAIAGVDRLKNSDSYMCGWGYSEQWSTYGKLKMAEFIKDGLMNVVRNSGNWLMCNDGAYPFGGSFDPHGAHQLGQNLDVRPFNSDLNFANTFHQSRAAKKAAAYSLLRAYRVAIDSWPCTGDENTECVTPIGAVRKSQEYCWKNLDRDEAFIGTNCPLPVIPSSVLQHYTHATRRQAIDDLSKYIDGMRNAIEVLLHPNTPKRPSRLIHSDGALDDVAYLYANQQYIEPQGVSWNSSLIFDGELFYRIGPSILTPGPAILRRVQIYRNGAPILSNSCSSSDSYWRMGSGCHRVLPKTTVEGVYDANFLHFAPISGHLDHIHIEVYD